MLGKHGLWAKRLFYEESAAIPLLLCGARGDGRVPGNACDDRLVGLQDVMPTLLDLAGIDTPDTVQGLSMVGEERRPHLFGEIGNGASSTRMVHDGRHKLIYYPVGNRVQLFDLEDDPEELRDLAEAPECAAVRQRLEQILAGELYGGDEAWVRDGKLVGLPDQEWVPRTGNRGLSGQRGGHFPPPSV
jgi:arylsulfatase A-like enzyme